MKKKKKLRANLQLTLGQYYQVLMTFLVLTYSTTEENTVPEEALKCTVQFPELDIAWPVIKPINNYTDAVNIFKLGNTQVQRSLKYFVVDGYVTDNVKLSQILSKLYK